jgi:2-amino-4-hydroxy-6-hydroxymethyldihydropteridine diphosphokinase
MTTAYVSIGSNLGDAVANVKLAIEQLKTLGRLIKLSSLYQTKPWGYTEQPDFINAVAALEVNCSAQQLMQSLLYIEKEMGRQRLIKWEPRIIDLDILLFGDLQISEPALTIPHPHMYKRAFVLIPLAEINPDFSAAVSILPQEALSEIKLLKNVEYDRGMIHPAG